jgi:hypothetical protein
MTERPARLDDVIIDGYIVHGDHAGGPNGWSYDVVNALIKMPLETSWPFVLELVHRVPDRQLGYLAAGPVEEFLGHHGEQVIAAVEAQANQDPRFRRVLRGVWQLFMSDAVFVRVVAASRREEATEDETGGLVEDSTDGVDWHATRRIELSIDGLPPGSTGDAVADAEALARLADAIRGNQSDAEIPFDGPVYLELVLCLAPTGTQPQATRVISTLSQALSVDSLERDWSTGVYSSASNVWDIRFVRLGAKRDSYTVTVSQMAPDQIKEMGRSGEPLEPPAP